MYKFHYNILINLTKKFLQFYFEIITFRIIFDTNICIIKINMLLVLFKNDLSLNTSIYLNV